MTRRKLLKTEKRITRPNGKPRILCQGERIDVIHLPDNLRSADPSIRLGDPVRLDKVEEEHIRRVLASVGSLQETADILGIDQATLWRRRKQYGI